MHRGYRYLGTLFLTAALAAPVAMMAAASAQDQDKKDQRDQKDQEHTQGENSKRYYDEGHKDYHTWDSNEDHAYQQYQTDHHEKRDFAQLSGQEQGVYWTWRHNNPDKK